MVETNKPGRLVIPTKEESVNRTKDYSKKNTHSRKNFYKRFSISMLIYFDKRYALSSPAIFFPMASMTTFAFSFAPSSLVCV